MKTIIKILVAAAVINAAVRVGMVEAGYYQFKDAAQELVTFGAQMAVGDIQAGVIAKANELDVPAGADDIDVRRDGQRTTVAAAYTEAVEVFPGFIYPMHFQFSVESFSMTGLGPNPTRAR